MEENQSKLNPHPFLVLLGKEKRLKFKHTCSGSPVKKEYQPVYDKRGVWHLEESGKKNIYLEIQSYADSTDINVIMARYRNGEVDVLQQVQGTYGDFSNIPTNYAEIMNQKIRAENLFMSLAPEVREKYGNSVEVFMSEIGTKAGLEKLGVKFPTEAPAPVEQKEVKADE